MGMLSYSCSPLLFYQGLAELGLWVSEEGQWPGKPEA